MAGLAITSIGPAIGAQQRLTGPVSSGVRDDFSIEALATPLLDTLKPLLSVTQHSRAGIVRLIEARLRTRSWQGNRALEFSRAPSNRTPSEAISAGFTVFELKRWSMTLSGDEQGQARLRSTLDVTIAQEAVDGIKLDIPGGRAIPWISRCFARHANELRIAMNDWNPDGILWFIAKVESPHRYLLGHRFCGLAVDLVLFLKQLQDTGTARDNQGAVVASLVDLAGQPYRHLVAEYVLHERLESSDLTHDEIIELTTELFRYGVFRAAEQPHASRRLEPGTRVFTRPGQTPMGQALRSFIDWRFKQRLQAVMGELVRVSYYDPSDQAVLSMQGTVTTPPPQERSEAFVRLVQENRNIDLMQRQILRIESIPRLLHGTFVDAATISVEQILQRLNGGFPVTLSEAQVRALAKIWSGKASAILRVLEQVRLVRDSEGRRVLTSMRLTPGRVARVLSWALALGTELAAENLQLLVEDVTFNQTDVFGKAGFVNYPDAPAYYAPEDEDELFRGDAEHLLNSILTFTHLTLKPCRAHEATAMAVSPSWDSAPPNNEGLLSSA